MALSSGAPLAGPLAGPALRDHGFHELRVRAVVRETSSASSFVLDVPEDLVGAYAYDPGQFLTFRCWIDGDPHLRSYSMSSAPPVDGELQVTVKRVPGGTVSNWMVDSLAAGDTVEATRPSGIFGRRSCDGDVLALAGGSGITPVLSVLKAVLATSQRRVRLLYANRDKGSVIFDSALDRLAARYGGRLEVVRHLDTDRGLVTAGEIERFAGDPAGSDAYVCGPAPFMALAEATLLARGAAPEAVHLERFTPLEEPVAPEHPVARDHPARVTVELDGRVGVADHRAGTTVLQTARQLGLSPPYSCEAGNCATCMAKLLDGEVDMHTNNALTDDEVIDGWILTCQAVPRTPSVSVRYGWED